MPCTYQARMVITEEVMTNMAAIQKALERMNIDSLRVQERNGRTVINGYYQYQNFEVVLGDGKARITSPTKEFGKKFSQFYKLERTKAVARKNNFFVKEKVEEGRIKLIMERK